MADATLLSRRAVLAWSLLAGAGLTACAGPRVIRADVARQPVDNASAAAAVSAVAAFSRDLVAAVAQGGRTNLICSPFSVLAVLAMVRNGATGATAREMDQALSLPATAKLNAGLNAVEQTLTGRTGTRRTGDGAKAKVRLDVAQQVWGQRGLVWQPAFLDVLAASYGTGVREMDIARDPSGATDTVNDWVADATSDRIKDLLAPGVVTTDTRLILANALYVKAPWHEQFEPAGTRSFAAPSGTVPAGMLQVTLPTGGRRGHGWTAARVPLAGQELALTVVLPDRSPAELLAELTGPKLLEMLGPGGEAVSVTMPGFTFRTKVALPEVLEKLGMARAFSTEAEFDGLTTTQQLILDHVEHQGWIAVDEHGLEAAAATAATAIATSAQAPPALKLVLDRPFLICVHDITLQLPLLLGIVADPTAVGD
ncbi:serpin family protein [uncultured Friedmanniella sp.]|uniref:serpin family protein n=1 Tax=uncultured Friedmanniella sp. TaxID=335381 RepID=UPI0035CA5894